MNTTTPTPAPAQTATHNGVTYVVPTRPANAKVATEAQVAKIVAAVTKAHPEWAAKFTATEIAAVFAWGFRGTWGAVTSPQAAVTRVKWILTDNVVTDADVKAGPKPGAPYATNSGRVFTPKPVAAPVAAPVAEAPAKVAAPAKPKAAPAKPRTRTGAKPTAKVA